MELGANIKIALDTLFQIMPEEDEWLVIKKQTLLMIHPAERKQFSTRDQKTKKHFPFNEFEQAVRDYWLSLTGIKLQIPAEKRLVEDDPGYI